MKLTTKGRYAVMAMADMAAACCERPIPLAEIAERQQISLSYLEQLFCKLRRCGLVESTRGPGGGYRLSRLPDAIRVADVIAAVDDPIQPAPAPDAGPNCLCNELWAALGQQVHRFLHSVTLADLVARRFAITDKSVERVD